MTLREALYFGRRNASRFRQRQDAREAFCPPCAQGYAGKVCRSDYSKWDPLKIGCLCLIHGFAGKLIEYRNELYRPGTNLYRLSYGHISPLCAKFIDRSEYVEPLRLQDTDQHVGVQCGDCLGVSHLRGGAEQSIFDYHAGSAHLVQQHSQISHILSLSLVQHEPNSQMDRRQPHFSHPALAKLAVIS